MLEDKKEIEGFRSSLFAIKIGGLVLDKFNKEMSKKKFTYKDYQELQDNYEKILEQALKSQREEFEKMIDEVCRKGCPDIANLKTRLKGAK